MHTLALELLVAARNISPHATPEAMIACCIVVIIFVSALAFFTESPTGNYRQGDVLEWIQGYSAARKIFGESVPEYPQVHGVDKNQAGLHMVTIILIDGRPQEFFAENFRHRAL